MGFYLTEQVTDTATECRSAEARLFHPGSTHPIGALLGIILSTKYWDDDTKLAYYGYRYYGPGVGRWLNRDPLQEYGGIGLYLSCFNNCINYCDVLGLVGVEIPVDNWIDMMLGIFMEIDAYHLSESGKVMNKIKAEARGKVTKRAYKTIYENQCTEQTYVIRGVMLDDNQYGGKLFTLPIPGTWGPLSYNFWTVGTVAHTLDYDVFVTTEKSYFGCICKYAAVYNLSGELKDKFDFDPNRDWETIKGKLYNSAAIIYQTTLDQLGFKYTEPTVDASWTDQWEDYGWMSLL